MPYVNGNFYMNPVYGRALERERLRTAGAGNPEPEIIAAGDARDGRWVTIDHRHVFIRATQNHPAQRLAKIHATRESSAQIAARVYHETSGLRPSAAHGPGGEEDLSRARQAVAAVIVNRETHGTTPGTAGDQLSREEQKAIQEYPPARGAYEDSLNGASSALAKADAGSGTNFYLDYGQRAPRWTSGRTVKDSYGPFINAAGGGDVRRGAKVYIRVY